jgi:hypothetical protein
MNAKLISDVCEYFQGLRHDAETDHHFDRLSNDGLITRLNKLREAERSVKEILRSAEAKP